MVSTFTSGVQSFTQQRCAVSISRTNTPTACSWGLHLAHPAYSSVLLHLKSVSAPALRAGQAPYNRRSTGASSLSPFCRQVPAAIPTLGIGHSVHSMAAYRAYVGEATPAAGEYHCNDFDWEELRQEAEQLLAARKGQQQVTTQERSCRHCISCVMCCNASASIVL